MGIIITKFRKKKTTYEILEKLENEIHSIEEFRRSTEQAKRKMVWRFILISFCVYCITALVLYFYFFPASAYDRMFYIIPLIIFPIFLILLKRILSWYYNRKIIKNQKKLTSLKDEKRKILDEVMDKETYKVAKSILEKFAPEQIKRPTIDNISTSIRSGASSSFNSTIQTQTGLRYRGQFAPRGNHLAIGATSTPRLQQPYASSLSLLPKPQPQNVIGSVQSAAASGNPLLLQRTVMPRERTALDKMVDYLVGDGPSNRYALICKNCSGHNGMALKEEFLYISFRCYYCTTFNSARKKRPIAPKLSTDVPLAIRSKRSDISDSDRQSDSDSDVPIITEPPSDSHERTTSIEEKVITLSNSDKLSDPEIKSSDTESSATEVGTEEQAVNQTNSTFEETVSPVTTEETKKED